MTYLYYFMIFLTFLNIILIIKNFLNIKKTDGNPIERTNVITKFKVEKFLSIILILTLIVMSLIVKSVFLWLILVNIVSLLFLMFVLKRMDP